MDLSQKLIYMDGCSYLLHFYIARYYWQEDQQNIDKFVLTVAVELLILFYFNISHDIGKYHIVFRIKFLN